MVETKNDGVITVTLLASELTAIINSLTLAAELHEDWAVKGAKGSDYVTSHERVAKERYALAGRLDDIR